MAVKLAVDSRLTACGVGLLGDPRVIFKGLGFGQEGNGLGDLRVPCCSDLEAFELPEL